MAAGKWVFTNQALQSLLNGDFDLDATAAFKVALFLSGAAVSATTTTYASISADEHANANGYTTGGVSPGTLTLSGTTTVTIDAPSDCVWTASGGSIVARWSVLYEVGGNVLAYSLLDSTPANVTATTGNTITVAVHVSGISTLTQVP